MYVADTPAALLFSMYIYVYMYVCMYEYFIPISILQLHIQYIPLSCSQVCTQSSVSQLVYLTFPTEMHSHIHTYIGKVKLNYILHDAYIHK